MELPQHRRTEAQLASFPSPNREEILLLGTGNEAKAQGTSMYHKQVYNMLVVYSLIPRPLPPPVSDCLQNEEEGLGRFSHVMMSGNRGWTHRGVVPDC